MTNGITKYFDNHTEPANDPTAPASDASRKCDHHLDDNQQFATGNRRD